MTTYTYGLSAFANEVVNSDRLVKEIRTSVITAALDGVGVTGDQCSIVFKVELSVGDKTVLDNIVAVHSGAPDSEGLPVDGGFVRQGFYPDFGSRWNRRCLFE